MRYVVAHCAVFYKCRHIGRKMGSFFMSQIKNSKTRFELQRLANYYAFEKELSEKGNVAIFFKTRSPAIQSVNVNVYKTKVL
jgi:hypothetical protein